MFERFTDRARRVVVLAQEESRELKHNYIGTEHFLLGMAREGECIAALVLKDVGLDLAKTRTLVTDLVKPGAATIPGHIPFTPRAKRVCELALREGLQLGHNYIGTEHLLLGLLKQEECTGALLLTRAGISLADTRKRVIERILVATPIVRTNKPSPTFGTIPASLFSGLIDGIFGGFGTDILGGLGQSLAAEVGDLTIGEAFERFKDTPLKALLENLFDLGGEQAS